MRDQMLWFNALAALVPGLCLVVAPKTMIALLGLPKTEQVFYARKFGAGLLGIVAALMVEARGGDGLGVAGAGAMAATGGLALAVVLFAGGLTIPNRGRWILRIATLVLVVLATAGLLGVGGR